MAPKTKEQKTAESGSINDLKEGDFLDPDLGLGPDVAGDSENSADSEDGSGTDSEPEPEPDPDAVAVDGVVTGSGADVVAGDGVVSGPDAGADAVAGDGVVSGPDVGADAVAGDGVVTGPGADVVAGDGVDPMPGAYIVVVVTGATLKHNGKVYPHSHTVKLSPKTAERLTAIGLVKPLSVIRQELEAKAKVGLTITTDAGGVEIITGG